MNLMETFVKINNFLIYLSFGVILIFTAIAAMSGNIAAALMFGIGGTFILALVFSWWACLNCILEENKKQTELLEKLTLINTWKGE